jgi:type II secretory pathway pseudopilin PulG
VSIRTETHDWPMPSETHRRSIEAAPGRAGCLRKLAGAESGFTIIEVVVTAVIVAALGAAIMTALSAVASVSGDQRRRSVADQVAQADQERMRGLSIKQLNGSNTLRNTTLDGTKYYIQSTGKFISNSGQNSCVSAGTGSAAYVLIKTRVNWPGNLNPGTDITDTANWAANSRRPPIVQESLITPAIGGTLVTGVHDQDDVGVSGATVSISGPESESATTDTDGCVVFGGIATGDYTVAVTKANYVDANGNLSPSIPTRPATVSNAGTSFPVPNPFKIGAGGTIQASFSANSGVLTNQQAPSLTASNAGRATPLVTTVATPASSITTTPTLFPFNTGTAGVYTGNYPVWAGKCIAEQPLPGTNRTTATVSPGATATPAVKEPALNLVVTYAGTRQKPGYAKITYTQTSPSACTETWLPPIVSDAATNPNGSLTSPGQPFAGSYTDSGVTYTGTYTYCAGYNPGSGMHYATLSGETLTNFASSTTRTIPIIATSPTSPPAGC